MPAAAPASGSKRSKVSTSAVHSPRAVAAASAAQARLVRPDDCGPTISESCPRGIPPRSTWLTAAEGNGAIDGACAGITEVSVRSSLRARSNDNSPEALAAGLPNPSSELSRRVSAAEGDGRAAMGMTLVWKQLVFSLFIRLGCDYSEDKTNVKAPSR